MYTNEHETCVKVELEKKYVIEISETIAWIVLYYEVYLWKNRSKLSSIWMYSSTILETN